MSIKSNFFMNFISVEKYFYHIKYFQKNYKTIDKSQINIKTAK